MTLVTANPRRKARNHTSVFDAFLNDFLVPKTEGTSNVNRIYRPAVNVLETKEDYKLALAIPGFAKEDVNIQVEKDILTIEANKTIEKVEGETYLRKEIELGTFKRTFQLPETIDVNNIAANFKNGILSIELAKKEEAKELPPRTIEING